MSHELINFIINSFQLFNIFHTESILCQGDIYSKNQVINIDVLSILETHKIESKCKKLIENSINNVNNKWKCNMDLDFNKFDDLKNLINLDMKYD